MVELENTAEYLKTGQAERNEKIKTKKKKTYFLLYRGNRGKKTINKKFGFVLK